MTTYASPPEILQCFTEEGRPTEGQLRTEVKTKPYRWWYGVSNIWLVNHHAQILCSKRSEVLTGNPGKWQTYFGGHLPFGLSFEECAQKELAEETGLEVELNKFFLVDQGKYEENKQFYKSYAVLFNGSASDLIFTDQEVTEATWMTFNEYEQAKAHSPETWCHQCLPHHQKTILHWLSSQSI